MTEATVGEAVIAIVDALESLDVDYALGGAIAMGMAGYVRATADVDVLVALPAVRTAELVDALARAGFLAWGDGDHPLDATRWLADTRARGMCRLGWCGVPVELFVPMVPLQRAILERRWRGEVVEGRSCWLTTAEDLILLKMIFNRPKDLIDVQRLLVARQGELDLAYIESWSGRTLPAESGDALRTLIERYGRPLE